MPQRLSEQQGSLAPCLTANDHCTSIAEIKVAKTLLMPDAELHARPDSTLDAAIQRAKNWEQGRSEACLVIDLTCALLISWEQCFSEGFGTTVGIDEMAQQRRENFKYVSS